MGLPVGQTSAAPFDPAVVVSAYPAPALPAPCPTVQAVPVAASASPASVPDVSMRLAIANVRAKRAAVATVMNLVIVNMVCIAVWFSLSHGQDTYFWPKWVLCGSAAFAYVPVSRWVVASCVRDVFSRRIANVLMWWVGANLLCWTTFLMTNSSTTVVITTATWPVWVSAAATVVAAMRINSIVKTMPVTNRELREQMERMLPP